jgi:hypothetical protein
LDVGAGEEKGGREGGCGFGFESGFLIGFFRARTSTCAS